MTDNPFLEEYKLCNENTNHIDEHNWMWGSFLFGGSLAALGLALSQHIGPLRLLGLASLSSVVLTGYVLMVQRTKAIKNGYYSRMRGLEATYLRGVMMETEAHALAMTGSLHNFGHPEIKMSGPSRFDVLVFMVFLYNGILWAGVGFLFLTRH